MKIQATLVITVTLLMPFTAHAQFAVIDSANLTRAIQQVDAWKQQYQQMVEQGNQIKQTLMGQTGSRGLGSLATNPLLQATVPPDLLQTLSALQTNGTDGLSAAARSIREQTKIYDCENRTGDARILCQRLLNGTAQQQALLQAALDLTSGRRAQIQALQDNINATSDAKSIAELQARMQAENLQVNNDANRLMLMRALSEMADHSAEQTVREKEQRSLAQHSDGSDTFHFAPPAAH